jgi:putative ATPase
MDLFEQSAEESQQENRPLAERMRPTSLDAFCGQAAVAGPDGPIGRAVARDRIFSMILWGPPGCGKTTLARIVARETRSHFIHFSAVLSGLREIRAVIEEAAQVLRLYRRRTILFVDEIHRFNKNQQDAFLHQVESGRIILIGATTENPSFEVIAPLLSRCRVIQLEPLDDRQIEKILQRAIDDREAGLGARGISLTKDAMEYLVKSARGDARAALNGLEVTAELIAGEPTPGDARTRVTGEQLQRALQEQPLLYDKSGESHFNLISAFHKSLRGSDADAALYWLERMLQSGEDALYIARRMVRFAAEDVGNADPWALRLALDAVEAFRFLGHPEGDLVLMQAAVYLATAPKSNRIYTAAKKVKAAVREFGALPVPLHLRNAPTRLMQELGYGEGYRYAHDYPGGYVVQDHLPPEVCGRRFYQPAAAGLERTIRKRMDHWRRIADEERRRTAAENEE